MFSLRNEKNIFELSSIPRLSGALEWSEFFLLIVDPFIKGTAPMKQTESHVKVFSFVKIVLIKIELHGPSMFAVKAKIYGVLFIGHHMVVWFPLVNIS